MKKYIATFAWGDGVWKEIHEMQAKIEAQGGKVTGGPYKSDPTMIFETPVAWATFPRRQPYNGNGFLVELKEEKLV